ncbi:MAG: hypothetical protein KGO81_14840 [Bacteroidota bacterium]|nr:hypothetical protein [Bacteroidota bacterium]
MENLSSKQKDVLTKIIALAKQRNSIYNFRFFHKDFPSNEDNRYHDFAFRKLIKLGFFVRHSLYEIELTPKGEKFESFEVEKTKEWFKNLPSENWLLAEIIKIIVTLIIGATIGWFGKTLSYSFHNKPQLVIQKPLSNTDSISDKNHK